MNEPSTKRMPLAKGIALIVFTIATSLFVRFASWGLDDIAGYLANPVRRLSVWLLVLTALPTPWLLPPAPFSRGRKERLQAERLREGRVPLKLISIGLLALYILPPWCDRHAVLVLPGEGWRWLGLALEALGILLSIWGPYQLGRNFSGYVTLQEGHTLVTDGPYRYVRHPRYLGLLSHILGFGLLHRAALSLPLELLPLFVLVRRCQLEDQLLQAEFGDAWRAWAARTKRLIPGLW